MPYRPSVCTVSLPSMHTVCTHTLFFPDCCCTPLPLCAILPGTHCTHTPSLQGRAHAHARTHRHTHTCTHTHTRTQCHTRTHTHMRTHTHTRTHIHTPCSSPAAAAPPSRSPSEPAWTPDPRVLLRLGPVCVHACVCVCVCGVTVCVRACARVCADLLGTLTPGCCCSGVCCCGRWASQSASHTHKTKPHTHTHSMHVLPGRTSSSAYPSATAAVGQPCHPAHTSGKSVEKIS